MKIQKITALLIAFLFVIIPASSFTQTDILDLEGLYNEKIPRPEKIIGHKLGQYNTFHWEMENYLEAVQKASDRVILQSYGKTYEGRKLYYVIISSKENINRVGEIRELNLRLTDPRTFSREEAEKAAAWMPAIVWIGYNIHGSEASGMEAAIKTIYQLAAGEDEATKNMLKNTVCIIDPCQNPDGHERAGDDEPWLKWLKENAAFARNATAGLSARAATRPWWCRSSGASSTPSTGRPCGTGRGSTRTTKRTKPRWAIACASGSAGR